MSDRVEELTALYRNPKYGHNSPDAFYARIKSTFPIIAAKWSKKEIIAFVKSFDTQQTTNTQPIKKKSYYPIYAALGDSYQADLLFMQFPPNRNSGYNSLLVMINVNTKRGYAYPLKTKNAGEIAAALTNLIKEVKDDDLLDIRTLQTDGGLEFVNSQVKRVLDEYKIRTYQAPPYNHTMNSVVERFNQTLRRALVRVAKSDGGAWVKHLPDVLENYNETKHSATKHTPIEMSSDPTLEAAFIKKMTSKTKKLLNANEEKFTPGAKVRVMIATDPFKKDLPRFSEDVATVVKQDGRAYVLDNGERVLPYRMKKVIEVRKGAAAEPVFDLRPVQRERRIERLDQQAGMNAENVLENRVIRSRKPSQRVIRNAEI